MLSPTRYRPHASRSLGVDFAIAVGAFEVLCRITPDALVEEFGSCKTADDLLRSFQQNELEIVGKAIRIYKLKLLRGEAHFSPMEPMLIKIVDFW